MHEHDGQREEFLTSTVAHSTLRPMVSGPHRVNALAARLAAVLSTVIPEGMFMPMHAIGFEQVVSDRQANERDTLLPL